MLKNKKILIFVSGSIAIYKVLFLIRTLRKEGALVRVVATRSALKFITPLSFEVLSNTALLHDDNESWVADNAINKHDSTYNSYNAPLNHIGYAKWADLALFAPASANSINKLSQGIADNIYLSCAIALRNIPKLIAPSANTFMLENQATQKSIESFTDIREAESNKDNGLRPFTLVNRTGNITESLKQFVQMYDYIIIDTGGIDSQESRKAMLFADSLIVPTTPSHFDFEALYAMFERIIELKDINEAMQISIVMNKISTNVFLHKELLDFQNATTAIKERLDSNNDFRLLDNVLSERIAYKRAISEGKGITEYIDVKAKAEFEMVFEELLQNIQKL